MTDSQPGLTDLLNLLGSANPLGALTKNLDGMKKGVEALVTAVQTFTRTMESLEGAAKRVTSLLDEVEAPIRAVAAQLAALPENSLPGAIDNLNNLSANLSQLVTPLTGVAGLAGSIFSGLRTATSTPSSTPAADTSAPTSPAKGAEKPAAAKRRTSVRSKKGA
jgi:ABC-type transporter Mla subunit MlaD